jgi:ankyrin repeat protein
MLKMASAVKPCCLAKHVGSVQELAIMVMGRMREDESKHIRQMKKLIKDRKSLAVQIFLTNIDGWTPVHACAFRGSKNLLKVFLSSGIDINSRMGQPEGLPGNCTFLHLACLRGDMKLIEYIVSEKADLEAKDSNHMTPVMYAARRKHRRAILFLQEKGANMAGVELPAYDCITPQPTSAKFCFF